MKKILFIEDEKFVAELVTEELRAAGFEVFLAEDGEMGLQKLREEKPNILLLDILLPGIDGYEVLKQMTADPELSKIPVIVLSNLGQADQIERAMALGAKDFLVKANCSPAVIINKVNQYIK